MHKPGIDKLFSIVEKTGELQNIDHFFYGAHSNLNKLRIHLEQNSYDVQVNENGLLLVSKAEVLIPSVIEATITQLERLAELFGVDYDGWGVGIDELY